MIQPKENRVLYLLGAGFSAPLGLPVMSNFLSRSKDLYFSDRTRFGHFQTVYETISQLSVIKNTFHADLHNIEEILSLLEMEAFMKGEHLQTEFVRFLADVILNLLPPIEPISGRPGSSNWHGLIFNKNPVWKPYFLMMACMLSAKITTTKDDAARMILTSSPTPTRYAVVTLNYDTAIEAAFQHVVDSFTSNEIPPLAKNRYDPTWNSLQLAKLHGCARAENIVPPTWRKGSSQVVDAWKLAYNLIKDANQIRIIGYSLPVSDSYIRYLLKSAIRFSHDLKRIDILNYNQQSIEAQYREFIDFANIRFKNAKLETLFDLLEEHLDNKIHRLRFKDSMEFDQLETAHQHLFDS